MVQTQLLCEILDSGGGGGGGCACLFGSGSPEGVVVAAEGSTYVRTDTGGFWYKVSGAGNVGWYEGFV